MFTQDRLNRRGLLLGLGAVAARTISGARPTAAQDETPAGGLSEVPSMGGRRAGPIAAEASFAFSRAPRGETPAELRIPNAMVDSPVERLDIVDGVMLNPSGPWVVSWYHDLGTLGRGQNVVMAGHVDYWDIGPAVFWNLSQLAAGDQIEVVAESGNAFTYAVEWMKNYVVAEMTAEDLDEMLGDAGSNALTLITCTIGSWDPETQSYRERTALRAVQVS